MNQKKIEEIDELINFLINNIAFIEIKDLPTKEELIKIKESKSQVIDKLNELKGFFNFIDKYGEAKLDVLNVANLSLDKIKKTDKDFCESIWYAFNVGRKCEKEGLK
jgi:hypothetical protein